MEYPIYMDFNATTPLDERVLNAMLPYLTHHFGNAASRSHAYGWKAADAVEKARLQVAKLLKVSGKEIIFTSGATEAINLAIKGVFEASKLEKKHIITIKTEHKAVIDTCQHLEKLGASITYLAVDKEGNIDLQTLENAIKPNTILISAMIANNETGIILPIEQIATIAKKHQVLLHTDVTQAIGKTKFSTNNIDLLSFSGHKIYAPKGVGVLFARKNTLIVAQQDGGKHERGLRSGTLNVASIVALGEAADICAKEMEAETARLTILRDTLEQNILSNFPFAKINGSTLNRLPNTSNICFGEIDGEALLMKLNQVAVSNGSACNSASTEPSYVLKSMGLSDAEAYGSIRFSLGRTSTEKDIAIASKHIIEVVSIMMSE